jgi:pyrroline-5-carboxylate reductase
MMNKFGFIGTGNMGGALAGAVAKRVGGENMLLADYFQAKAEEMAEKLGAKAADNMTVAAECDYVFLGVKPQMMAGVLAGIAPVLTEREKRVILVTMAAGLTMETICEMAGGAYPVIRLMPNTSAAIGEGMILYTANELVTETELATAVDALSMAGRLDRLDEKLIDAGCAISGCGPAYAYMLIEALADGGVICGLPRAKAMEYAAQMLVGAGRMVLETGKHPGELKDAVCSPAGSTIAGVHALENGGFRGAAINAVTAAYGRNKELAGGK